ncbi:putative FxsA cytoplasmic membrane protein [Candidatus Micropelagos thuwalensis]|uniref:Putative FxsA cytoplasmic membrane protein n=1 Tax=Candidatus Micropelagius thuwalensis TaxID=1397666 RepID=U2WAC1_9PROT|nr:TonB-dependent receptor [Candidatus Micropelagos thuwalensis]ERL46539.1 putative FxsA cytoplasmic membrane protein [Candidatus Micropelagos thuwalensis]
MITKLPLKKVLVSASVLMTAFAGAMYSEAKAQAIDEIVVTSQKRAAGISVQDIATSVTAVNADLIEATDSIDLTDVGRLAPNATLHPSATFASTPNFLIRGIGVSGTTRSLDPSVGVIVDGVYLGFPVGANLDMFDRESVEILRGPQGTLLGRNVTGGAIVVRTARPTGEFGGKVNIVAGDYDRLDVSASIEGPLVEGKVSAKVAFMSRSRDGYWEDNNGGTIVPSVASTTFRGGAAVTLAGEGPSGTKPDVDLTIVRPMLYFTPSDNLDITLMAEFLRDKSGTANSRNFVHPTAAPRLSQLFGYTPPSDPYEINHNLMGGNDLETDTFIAEFNYQTQNGKLTGIASYRELTYDSSTDFDGTPFTIFHFPDNHEEQEQTTMELRYAANVSDKLSYVVGVSTFDQEFFVGERRLIGSLDISGATELEHETMGIFAELDYMMTDQLKLTVGARYTEEEKDVLFNAIGSCNTDFTGCQGANAGLTNGGKFDDTTPKVALTYFVNDDVNVYASYTEGFRSGSFDARARTTDSFLNSRPGPETVESFELGFKSLLNDDKLLLNVAVFSAKYDDIQKLALEPCQLGTPGCDTGNIQRLINAAEATIEGIEIETKAFVTDSLVLEGALGYTDAGYDSFSGFDADGTPGYDPVTDPAAAAALDFERVPELTYTVAASYNVPMASGSELDFRVSYAFTDDFTNDATGTAAIATESYGLLDASVSYTRDSDGLKLTLFGKNITDEEYHDFALDNALTRLTWGGTPSTYGVKAAYSF